MAGEQEQTKDVAVVGTGLAGLLTAYLLQQDPKRRYRVTLFEKEQAAALGAASVLLRNDDNGQIELVDIPMRSFNPGYYHNFVAMLNHLRIRSRWNKFLFAFSSASSGPYYLHASDRQRILPVRPATVSLVQHILRVLFLAICYIWLSLVCYLVDPSDDESIGTYLRRTHVPKTFTKPYLVPLLSSVATCTHEDFLKSPASDFVSYKRQIWHSGHFQVENGVWELEEKLIQGIDCNFGCEIDEVRPTTSGVQLLWRTQDGKEQSRAFQHVVLAVAPSAITKLYPRLRDTITRIPTMQVKAHVLQPRPGQPQLTVMPRSDLFQSAIRPDVQTVTLESHAEDRDAVTSACQRLGNGAEVLTTIRPKKYDPSAVISKAVFTRTQRTVESRRLVNSIFDCDTSKEIQEEKQWRNGEDGIWLAGAWCWDGFVLLEGCVVSAIRVAKSLDVEIPWAQIP